MCVLVCVCVGVCVGVCMCVREGPRPSRDASSSPSRGFRGLPPETLKGNPSRGFTFVPPSLLQLSTPTDLNLLPKFGHPFLPRLTLNFSFLFSVFVFPSFLHNFFWRGSFFFSFLFGRQCPCFFVSSSFLVACALFFFGRRRAGTKLCASFGVGSKGWVPKTRKSGRPMGGGRRVEARRVEA